MGPLADRFPMDTGYQRASLADLDPNPTKPADRWEVSKHLGIDGYNFNVAVLEPGEPMAQSGLHYHTDQEEFFYVIDGRCRVELEEGSFDLATDEMVVFREGTAQLIHNPFDQACKLIAIGHPPSGHETVRAVESTKELLARRYPEEG